LCGALSDTIQFPHYEALRAGRNDRDALAALTLRHPPQGDRFTPVYFDDGRITRFGRGTGEALMFSGTHLIANSIFDYLQDKEFSGIVDEVYQPLLDSGREQIAGVVDDALWFDIGTPQRYMSASRTLLDAMIRGQLAAPNGTHVAGDSLIHETATTTGSMTRSIAGERSAIEGILTDTIVWDDCRIARGQTSKAASSPMAWRSPRRWNCATSSSAATIPPSRATANIASNMA